MVVHEITGDNWFFVGLTLRYNIWPVSEAIEGVRVV